MKFPFYKQLDGMDCGPSCLRMIARYHGKKFSVQQLREQSFIQRTGVNMQGISEAATSIGMRATGIRTTIDKLKQQSRLPCILHWNQIHFVVLYNIVQKKGKTYFYIADPAYGLLKYEEEELKKCWISTSQGGIEKGIAMLLEVTPQFYDTTPIKYEGISLWHLLRYVHPYRKMIVQLIIGLLAGSVLQLAFPFLTQTIVDQGIGHRNLNFIQLILAAQLMLVFSRTLIEVIRRCILLHISTRVNVALISDFLVKLMRLPMRFFDSKLAGDLIRRIEDHKRIEMFLTQSVLSILFATITIIIFGGVLAVYNLKIFLLFLPFQYPLRRLGKALHAQACRPQPEELRTDVRQSGQPDANDIRYAGHQIAGMRTAEKMGMGKHTGFPVSYQHQIAQSGAMAASGRRAHQ